MKNEARELAINNLKLKMIHMVKEHVLPVGFIRGEADGNYGIVVERDLTIKGIGYAEGCGPTLADLSIVDLAELIDHGVCPGEEEWRYIEGNL